MTAKLSSIALLAALTTAATAQTTPKATTTTPHHTTTAAPCQAVPALLGPGHPVLAPGPARLRTPDDLRRHAAAAGITIPDPPPPGRLRR